MFLHITILHRHVHNCITLRNWNMNHINRFDRALGFMYTQSGGKSHMVMSGNFPHQIEVLIGKSKECRKLTYKYVYIYISRCISIYIYNTLLSAILLGCHVHYFASIGLQNNTRHGIIMMIMLLRANWGYGIHQDIQPSIDIWIQPGSTPHILPNQYRNVENWYGNKALISASWGVALNSPMPKQTRTLQCQTGHLCAGEQSRIWSPAKVSAKPAGASPWSGRYTLSSQNISIWFQ